MRYFIEKLYFDAKNNLRAMDKSEKTSEACELEKFTSAEYYYIISGLLGLGDPGFGPERLYLSFDQNELGVIRDVKFFFLTQPVIYEGEKEIVEYCIGRIDRLFDNIEIYRWYCDPEVMSPEKSRVNIDMIRSTLSNKNYPLPFRPASFLNGINRIISESDFGKRNDNDLFNLKWHLEIPYGLQHQFDFGQIGQLGTNFSGNYFLVVEPNKANADSVIVNSFHVSLVQIEGLLTLDGERVHVSECIIDATSIQLYDNGKSSTLLAPSRDDFKKYQKHKSKMLAVLTDTVLSLLNDLSPSMREHVLENEPPEELVIFCKEKYDQEFDLHVKSLGIAGAHEIAWQEALSILRDDQTEETNF